MAIKVLNHGRGRRHQQRLAREAKALAQLSHPNVVQVHDVGTFDGRTFVAMELVVGQTLRQWQRRDPRPGWRACVEAYLQAGAGLAAAHQKGLVHRDFKPSNAIIDEAGRVRVLDFGLARVEEDLSTGDGKPRPRSGADLPGTPAKRALSGERLTQTGMVVGTPAYMSLEQLRGEPVGARSDQFSFCVALFEAVYGERPFAGRELGPLEAQISAGTIVSSPTNADAPAGLRSLLLRGLAADPQQRWPSMGALLQQLRRLSTPRPWGRWMLLGGLGAGMLALGVGSGYQAYVAQQRERAREAELAARCTGARAELAGVWDEQRRREVEASVLATGVSYAAGTWVRVEPRLDELADAWVGAHTEICAATSIRHEQAEEVMELRMGCLRRHRQALRRVVDVLAHADPERVEHAVASVAKIPSLDRCDDVERLRQRTLRVPPPDDPRVAERVEVVRNRMADLEATERPVDADVVDAVVAEVEALGYPPLEAEVESWRGFTRVVEGRYADAEPLLERAYALAVAHGHDAAALRAAQRLTVVVGFYLARHAEGRQWGRMSALPLAEHAGDPREVATSLSGLANVLQNQGEYAQAQEYFERALRLQQRVLGSEHVVVAGSLRNLGNMAAIRGEYEQARQFHERSLRIYETVLGPAHPDVARGLVNLGIAYDSQGQPERAREHYERALRIQEEALGPRHLSVGQTLRNLGITFARAKQFSEAIHYFERSQEILEEGLGADHQIVGTSLNTLGAAQLALKQHARALESFERSQRILEGTLGPEHPEVAYVLVGRAMAELATGAPQEARLHAERALAIYGTDPMAPEQLAEARFTLARALWSDRTQHARARALAEQAREGLNAASGPGQVDLDIGEVETWLAEHPRPRTRGRREPTSAPP